MTGRGSGRRLAVAAVAAALWAAAAPASAAPVRLHGATTVVDRVVAPHQAAVEKATGSTLEVVGNATGRGLVDLVDGRCDASLSSEPLEIALAAAATAGKRLDPARLQFHVVAHDEIVFVVHPSNAVTSLTREQLRGIHTGRIRNWKEVGGKDQPITVYTDTPTGGTRAMVKTIVLGGQEYGATVVPLAAVKKVADMVAVDPTGIGGLGKGFVDARVRVVKADTIERPLGFVTLGAPTPQLKAVVDAFRAAMATR